MEKKYVPLKNIFFVLIAFLFFTKGQSQCAGDNTSVVICDITDVDNQNISLFDLLDGNPQTGGTWVDEDNANIFIDQQDGTINLWWLNLPGIFEFTYVISDPNCTDQEATVTITVGGYAGEDNFSANACSNDPAVNLFQFIGSGPNPHLGGFWSDDSNTGALSGSIYDATSLGTGTYMFTYTVAPVGSCPSDSSTVELTVHPLPFPGIPTGIQLCGLDDISNYTNVDLLDYLDFQEPNGVWGEISGTSELSSPQDHFINVENIYNNFGYGRYDFTYTVLPSHPVCPPQFSIITVNIRQVVDFTGTELVVDSFCENEITEFTVFLDNLPGIEYVPNYTYLLEYEINGPVSYTDEAVVTINNPSFVISENFIPVVGSYTIEITEISILNDPEQIVCHIIWDLSTTFEVVEIPDLEGSILEVEDICVGEDAQAILSNAVNVEGDYTITYEISGANTAIQNTLVNIQNGTTTFPLDSSLLTNVGTTTVTITHIADEFCENEADVSAIFEVNPLPDLDSADITIGNVCLGEPISILISNINGLEEIEIEYNISGANTISDQAETVTVVNNTVEITLPASAFPNEGAMTFQITHLSNLITGCENEIDASEDFEIYALPDPPSPESIQEFCETEEPSVANLIPQGNSYHWYESDTSTTPLNTSTPLVEGTYWVAMIDSNGCHSEKTAVAVIINTVPPVTLIPSGEQFCGADQPTIDDLSANSNASGAYEIHWYDVNGNPLPGDIPLSENETYYGYFYDEITHCESLQVLEVNITLTACDEEDYDFFVPDAFSPNGDNINDTFRIPDIQFLFPDYEYEIYNRYGKLLFIGNINRPEWDGKTTEGTTLSDGVAPNGVYFYILKFNKGTKMPQQGRLFLNR